jgi:hypothetical protein
VSNVLELLQSTGPIALNELSLRLPGSSEELVRQLADLKKWGDVVVTGPKAEKLLELTPEEISRSSDIVVELSRSSLKRSFAM